MTPYAYMVFRDRDGRPDGLLDRGRVIARSSSEALGEAERRYSIDRRDTDPTRVLVTLYDLQARQPKTASSRYWGYAGPRAKCHPTRPLCGRGLCHPCYWRIRRRKN